VFTIRDTQLHALQRYLNERFAEAELPHLAAQYPEAFARFSRQEAITRLREVVDTVQLLGFADEEDIAAILHWACACDLRFGPGQPFFYILEMVQLTTEERFDLISQAAASIPLASEAG
jgi:hypothetical protein